MAALALMMTVAVAARSRRRLGPQIRIQGIPGRRRVVAGLTICRRQPLLLVYVELSFP